VEVGDLLNIYIKIFIAYYLETNRYKKRLNKTLEKYLYVFWNIKLDNGSEILLIGEYVYNNLLSSAMAIFPFYAN
jgi:hypothetical protein